MLLTSRKNALNKSRKRVKKGRNVLSFHDEVDIIENCMPRQHCIALNESSKKIVFLQKKQKRKQNLLEQDSRNFLHFFSLKQLYNYDSSSIVPSRIKRPDIMRN